MSGPPTAPVEDPRSLAFPKPQKTIRCGGTPNAVTLEEALQKATPEQGKSFAKLWTRRIFNLTSDAAHDGNHHCCTEFMTQKVLILWFCTFSQNQQKSADSAFSSFVIQHF